MGKTAFTASGILAVGFLAAAAAAAVALAAAPGGAGAGAPGAGAGGRGGAGGGGGGRGGRGGIVNGVDGGRTDGAGAIPTTTAFPPAPGPVDAGKEAELLAKWKDYKAPVVAGQEVVPGATVPVASTPSGWVPVHNDFYWTDDTGARIQTRSGCLYQFAGHFYWYGGTNGFHDQMCYESDDLVHWVNKGVVLHHEPDANRIDVLYNDETQQYVMFLKYNTNGARLAIATANKPEGPFTLVSQVLVDNARMGDMSAFKDTDGRAYIAYVSWATGTNAQHGIYRMSPDYLTLDKRMQLWDIRGREAPHIMKRNGIYYYGTSKTAGIASSDTAYYTAKSLEGPWSKAQPLSTPGMAAGPGGEGPETPASKNSWDSQVDFVFPIQGSKGTVYMYAGDRWTKDYPAGRNGDYVWLPVEWNGDVPVVRYYQDWEVNLAEGTWRAIDSSRDLALGKKVTASSEVGDNKAENVTKPHTYADYIGSYWESAASDPQWIQVDLGSAMDVNRVILKWNTTAAKDFKVETSVDGKAWNEVYSTGLGSSYAVTDETFKTVSARYVRVEGASKAVAGGGRGGFGGGRAGGRAGGAAGGGAAPAGGAAAGAGGAPAIAPGGGGGGGGRAGGRGGPAATAGYSVFDFEVMKD